MSVRLFPLVPMGAGDILDQAIRIYRQDFVTVVGIVAIFSVPLLLINVLAAALTIPLGSQFSTIEDSSPFVLVYFLATIITTILSAIASVFQVGALAVVISERYLGHTITIRQAYARTFKRWLSLLLAIIIIGLLDLALLTVFFLPFFALAFAAAGSGSSEDALAGILVLCSCLLFIPVLFLLVYLNVHWIFVTQAIVLESHTSTGGMGRSWRLVKGTFWRVLGFSIILSILVGLFSAGPIYLVSFASLVLPSVVLASVLNSIIQTAVQVLVTPIQFAAVTLLYYDLRIRKEGFDLQLQLQQPPPSASPTPGALA